MASEANLGEVSNFPWSLDELNAFNVLAPKRRVARLLEVGGIKGLASMVRSDVFKGLSAKEARNNFRKRREEYGINSYPVPPSKTFLALFIEAFDDTTVQILIVAAVVSILVAVISATTSDHADPSEWIEGVAILVAVLIVATVTAGNDYQKERQFRQLRAASEERKCDVIRDDSATEIVTSELCVGDIVVIKQGIQVPADGVLITGTNVSTNESVMTGETMPIKKNDAQPFMLSGCQVDDGEGKMLVTAVGVHSEWGKLFSSIPVEFDETPMQVALGSMATAVGYVGMVVAAVVFMVLMAYWAEEVAGVQWDFARLNFYDETDGPLRFFIVAVTVVVVAVPEGLPLAVVISLAYSVGKMMEDQNLVRHLAACEIMGGATNICSDKTGTLTINVMTVTEGFVGGERFSGRLSKVAKKLSDECRSLLFEGIALNSTAEADFVDKAGNVVATASDSKVDGKEDAAATRDDLSRDDIKKVFRGNPTECALLRMIDEEGYDFVKVRRAVGDLSDNSNDSKRVPFNSKLKRMLTIVPLNGGPKARMFIKGASEVILRNSSRILMADGKIKKMGSKTRRKVEGMINDMASNALRTLCMAYRDFDKMPSEEVLFSDDAPTDDLTLIALVGIEDPVREEVPGSVRTCHDAGITVRMITGDQIVTAKKIAEQCAIFTKGGLAIEGPRFAKLSDAELDELLPRLQVIARSSPQDKLRLVERLKFHGEIVAVTGDGTNDGPALKAADVGLSMGDGTDVAKQASDIVILDSNFHSIEKSVLWGRSVFDNIRKFLQFQLTVNYSALLVTFLASLFNKGLPLKPVQMLWINLIMDTLAALALATEPPTPDLLNRPPINVRRARLLSNKLIKHIVGQGTYQVIVLMVMLFNAHTWFDNVDELGDKHYTLIFNSFTFAQIFNEINSRKINDEFNCFSGILNNALYCGIIVITAVMQFVIVTFGGKPMSTVPLTPEEWGVTVAIGAISLPLGLALRLLPIDPPMPKDERALMIDPAELAEKYADAPDTMLDIDPNDSKGGGEDDGGEGGSGDSKRKASRKKSSKKSSK